MRIRRTGRRWVPAVVAVVVLAACGDDPVDPDPEPEPTIASIEVTSEIDSLVAVGSGADLTAVARDDAGAALASQPTFTWISSNPQAASVTGAGRVSGLAAGAVTITASADDVSGTLRMAVVAADMDGLAAAVADPFAAGVVNALSDGQAGSQAAWAAAEAGIASGNLVQVDDALATLSAAAASATGHDRALLAVAMLFVRHMEVLLNL